MEQPDNTYQLLMDIFSKFRYDSNTGKIRMKSNVNNNEQNNEQNNTMNNEDNSIYNILNIINNVTSIMMNNDDQDIEHFEEYIECSYCGQLIDNDLNSYINHIVSSNHIPNNINRNNYYINRLINPNNRESIFDRSRENKIESYVNIINGLNDTELNLLNENLNIGGYDNFDAENQDLLNSQEYIEVIKDNLILMGYLNVESSSNEYSPLDYDSSVIDEEDFRDIYNYLYPENRNRNSNSNLMNLPDLSNIPFNNFSNRLIARDENLHRNFEEFLMVNGMNRFQDSDFDDIKEEGLSLDLYSREYKIQEVTRCHICMEDHELETSFNEMVCKHSFCHRCSGEWFKDNNRCPLCNVNLIQLKSQQDQAINSQINDNNVVSDEESHNYRVLIEELD